MELHLRVHTNVLPDVSEFVTFLQSKTILVLVVKEVGSKEKKEHLHIVLKPKKTVSTFRQQLLKQYPSIKGNGSYSLEQVKDYQKMIRYCCKGDDGQKPNVIFNSDINIEEEHKQFWLKNAELKTEANGVNMGCQNDPPIVKKVKTLTWTEKVAQEIKNEFESECMVIQNFQLLYKPTEKETLDYNESRRMIFRYVLKRFGPKKINDNIIRDAYNGFINDIIHQNPEAGDARADKLFKYLFN